ncbi:hypothetical protein R6242_02600 [Iodobacter sp. CM08]|uniref:hypothetical protein n=1 Tax=Iodobacter sp. CM08 TaxID=3085902 RepID=UPI0029813908|nr:hypothetical protein [Iodobacter sp. CM08]MDW5415458.1 hypothetical protein [Iodobacter sp. CM08]
MKIAGQAWQFIRHDLILSGAALVCALLFIGLAQTYLGYMQAEQLVLRSHLQSLTLQADAQETAWNNAVQYGALYQRLSRQGIINVEHRLDWIEYLTELNREVPQLKIAFRLEPQRPLSAAVENVQLYGSKMQLNFEIKNEEVFSDVLAGLQQLAGWPAPEQCVLARSEEARIKVACDIEWLSIGPIAQPVAEVAQ